MDLETREQAADKIMLYNLGVHVSLEEPIMVRQMCNGQVVYVFEYLDATL
jgi:hypothetical protein